MVRCILILVSLSILNQSIDIDYLTSAFKPVSGNYDDVDTITEYVIEHIMDDDDYIPEDGDDHNGMPQNGVEKSSWHPLCCQFFQKIIVIPTNNTDPSLQAAFQQVCPTCKGYFNIVSPPPDVWAA